MFHFFVTKEQRPQAKNFPSVQFKLEFIGHTL